MRRAMLIIVAGYVRSRLSGKSPAACAFPAHFHPGVAAFLYIGDMRDAGATSGSLQRARNQSLLPRHHPGFPALCRGALAIHAPRIVALRGTVICWGTDDADCGDGPPLGAGPRGPHHPGSV